MAADERLGDLAALDKYGEPLPPEYEDQPRARITVTPQPPPDLGLPPLGGSVARQPLPDLPPLGGSVARQPLPADFAIPSAPEQPGIIERSLPKVYDPIQQQQQSVAKTTIG